MNTNLQRKLNGMKMKVQANQPKIMVYGGVGMMAAGTATAVIATNKLPKLLDEMEADKFAVNNGLLTGEDLTKELTKVTMKGYGKIALNYAPSIALTIGGAASILGGFGIIDKRYVGVSAALATTTDAFNKYRANVVDEYGEEVDYRMKHSIKTTETVEVDADGNTTVTEETTWKTSQYAVTFDKSSSSEWKDDANYNYCYIKNCENYLNTVLQARGHVFLNEVYDQLGMNRTEAGAVTGWIYKDGGDGYIDLGLESFKKNAAFMDGKSPDVILDFNVDGVIFDIFQQ